MQLRSKIGIALVAFAIITLLAMAFMRNLVRHKIGDFLDTQLGGNVALSYDSIHVVLWSGQVVINNINTHISNKNDSLVHTEIAIDLLQLDGFSYYDYLFKKRIRFERITINHNEIVYFKDRHLNNNSSSDKSLATIIKSVQVDKLQILDNKLTIYDQTADSTLLYVPKAQLVMSNLRTNKRQLNKKIPITYTGLALKADSIIYKLSDYRDFKIAKLTASANQVTLDDASIVTKHSMEELSQILTTERDHIRMDIDQIKLQIADFGFDANTFFMRLPKAELIKPMLHISRDKLVANNLSYKPLYSKMLRGLSVKLLVDSLNIINGKVSYRERTNAQNDGGILTFSSLNATATNVGNAQAPDVPTLLKINAIFQKESRVQLDWSFLVHDQTDSFTIKGDVTKTPAAALNSFIAPNSRVRLNGTLDQIQFIMHGNDHTANTDLEMAYRNITVNVMRKNKTGKKNGLLSAVANVFVDTNSANKKADSKSNQSTTERDKTKSVFNFLWISIQSVMTKILL